MKIEDVMTRNVLTIGPEASVRDVANVLVEHGISGLPVCDEQRRVLGVVSEGDILWKEQRPPRRQRRPLAWLVGDGSTTAALAKSNARTAREAMSAPPITIAPYRSVAAAAQLMVESGVNRLPVVRHGVLVGIVTRADLVRAFTRPDPEIEREIRREVLERSMWIEPGRVAVEVERGHVKLAGTLDARSEIALLERLARTVPGVVSVESAVVAAEE
jgi:CBS domain-containing protein